MAVVVFCMAWSSGLFPYERILEPKVPPDTTPVALFLTHLFVTDQVFAIPERAFDNIATNAGIRSSGM
jgi:hypothetical protein